MEKRAVRDFEVSGDLMPYLADWAKQNNYHFKRSEGSAHIYQRGTGFLTAPMMFQASQEGSHVHIEAWVRGTFFARLGSLFILPAEMTIASGGSRGVIPRKMARGDVNKFLEGLQQPPIT
jgi:hypothetical protein